MWAFLGSECVFFASITTFFVYRNVIISGASGEPSARRAGDQLHRPAGLHPGHQQLDHGPGDQRRDPEQAPARGLWLLATAVLGTFFLAGQTYEFTKLAQEGLTLTSASSGSAS